MKAFLGWDIVIGKEGILEASLQRWLYRSQAFWGTAQWDDFMHAKDFTSLYTPTCTTQRRL